MAIVPNCARLEANTATYADLMDEVISFLQTDSQFWTLIDSEPGRAFLIESPAGDRGGMEWNDPEVSTWHDPDGEADNAIGPGGPGSDWSGLSTVNVDNDGYNDFSETAINNVCHVIELPDAFIWLVENAAGTRHILGGYIGIFASPFNASDVDEGLDIYGALVGHPDIYTHSSVTYTHFWITGSDIDRGHSRVRIGHGNWTNPHFEDISFDDISDGQMGGETGGRYFWAPTPFQVDESGHQPLVGYPKYLRTSHSSRDNKSVTPSVDTDQAWMYINSDNNSSSVVIIWNKTVTP